MGKRDAQFIMILDIDRVFSADELAAVRDRIPASRRRKRQRKEASGARNPRPATTMSTHEEALSAGICKALRFCLLGGRDCLGPEKKTMLEGRLKRRLRELNIGSYKLYCEYLFGQEGLREEKVSFIDVVTTNKTDSFARRSTSII